MCIDRSNGWWDKSIRVFCKFLRKSFVYSAEKACAERTKKNYENIDKRDGKIIDVKSFSTSSAVFENIANDLVSSQLIFRCTLALALSAISRLFWYMIFYGANLQLNDYANLHFEPLLTRCGLPFRKVNGIFCYHLLKRRSLAFPCNVNVKVINKKILFRFFDIFR